MTMTKEQLVKFGKDQDPYAAGAAYVLDKEQVTKEERERFKLAFFAAKMNLEARHIGQS
jgi:hypothetical protein